MPPLAKPTMVVDECHPACDRRLTVSSRQKSSRDLARSLQTAYSAPLRPACASRQPRQTWAMPAAASATAARRRVDGPAGHRSSWGAVSLAPCSGARSPRQGPRVGPDGSSFPRASADRLEPRPAYDDAVPIDPRSSITPGGP
jgi:hypothetical protein